MFYGQQQQDTRNFFFTSWEKFKNNQPLAPLEQQIVDVIIAHPEYHALLDNPLTAKNHFTQDEANPFLHMGLHIALQDQIKTDRPKGITELYNRMLQKGYEPLYIEHLMLEPLAECLWTAQQNNQYPDEQHYLTQLRKILALPDIYKSI